MDNFFSIFRSSKREAAPATPQPEKSGATYQTHIVNVATPSKALTLSAVFRAVNIISDSIANLTLEYQRRNTITGHYEAYLRDTGRLMNHLLSVAPNSRQNRFQFMKGIVVHQLLHGNAYVYPLGGMEEPQALILCSPNSVMYESMSNTYTINDAVNGIYRSNVPAKDILHFRNFVLDHSGIGISTIAFARQSLNESATLQDESTRRAATGGRFKAIVSQEEDRAAGLPGMASIKEQTNTKIDLQKQVDEGDDLLLIRNGMKVTPWSMSAADMQFIEQRKLSIADIARFFNVPKSMLMEDSNAKYNTPAQAMQELRNYCLQPIIADIESEFNQKLGSVGKRFAFNTEALHNLDAEGKAKYYQNMFNLGVFCTNEIRAKEGLPPVEGGDKHYISTNVAELGSAKLSGNVEPPTPTPEP